MNVANSLGWEMALALRVAPSDEAIKKGSWERPERGFDTEFSRGPQAEGFNLKAKEQQSSIC